MYWAAFLYPNCHSLNLTGQRGVVLVRIELTTTSQKQVRVQQMTDYRESIRDHLAASKKRLEKGGLTESCCGSVEEENKGSCCFAQ